MVTKVYGSDTVDSMHSQQVRIQGLRYEGDDLFTITGVKPRLADWATAATALGLTDSREDQQLMDDIGELIYKADLVRLFASRVKVV